MLAAMAGRTIICLVFVVRTSELERTIVISQPVKFLPFVALKKTRPSLILFQSPSSAVSSARRFRG
jgi:hypothetical protein